MIGHKGFKYVLKRKEPFECGAFLSQSGDSVFTNFRAPSYCGNIDIKHSATEHVHCIHVCKRKWYEKSDENKNDARREE